MKLELGGIYQSDDLGETCIVRVTDFNGVKAYQDEHDYYYYVNGEMINNCSEEARLYEIEEEDIDTYRRKKFEVVKCYSIKDGDMTRTWYGDQGYEYMCDYIMHNEELGKKIDFKLQMIKVAKGDYQSSK